MNGGGGNLRVFFCYAGHFFFFLPFSEFPRWGPFFWEELKAWFSFWLLQMKPVEPVEARADVDLHMGVGTIRFPDLSD